MHALSQQKIHIHVKFRYKNPYFTRFFCVFTITVRKAQNDRFRKIDLYIHAWYVFSMREIHWMFAVYYAYIAV